MRLSFLVLLAMAATTPALAEPINPSESGRAALARFQSLDRNGDKALTRAELLARGREYAADALFVMLDADGDGRLSLKEMQGRGVGALIARFDAYDVNKDGYVTRREFPNFPDPLLFTALDQNRDGRLELGEIRPQFAGWRAAPPATASPRIARSEKQPSSPPPCWIPSTEGWGFEVPAVCPR
ncbi:MAG: EF-hand domain-containing protein [Solirubrobacterales bacterium]